MPPIADDDSEHAGARGVARRVDSLGRVVIPMAYRKVFAIRDGDLVDLTVEGDGIMLRRLSSRCVFCETTDDLGLFKGRLICITCVQELQVTPEARGS